MITNGSRAGPWCDGRRDLLNNDLWTEATIHPANGRQGRDIDDSTEEFVETM